LRRDRVRAQRHLLPLTEGAAGRVTPLPRGDATGGTTNAAGESLLPGGPGWVRPPAAASLSTDSLRASESDVGEAASRPEMLHLLKKEKSGKKRSKCSLGPRTPVARWHADTIDDTSASGTAPWDVKRACQGHALAWHARASWAARRRPAL